MGFSLKKLAKGIVKHVGRTVASVGSQTSNAVEAVGEIGSGILTGNSDKIMNAGKDYIKGTGQNLSGLTGGATSVQSKQMEADKAALAQEQALAAEEAARPEKERNDLLNKQFNNTMLKSGGRKFNSLMGGGYF